MVKSRARKLNSQVDVGTIPLRLLEYNIITARFGTSKLDGKGHDKELLGISKKVKFLGNGDIRPVSLFELAHRYSSDMISILVGKYPVVSPLEISKYLIFKNVLQN